MKKKKKKERGQLYEVTHFTAWSKQCQLTTSDKQSQDHQLHCDFLQWKLRGGHAPPYIPREQTRCLTYAREEKQINLGDK